MRPLKLVVAWVALILSISIGSSLPEAQSPRSISDMAFEARRPGATGHLVRWAGAGGRMLREIGGAGRTAGFGGKGMSLSLSLRGGSGEKPRPYGTQISHC